MSSKPLQFLHSLSISVGLAFATSCFSMVAGMAAATGALALAAIGASMLLALVVARAVGSLARRYPSALGLRTYIRAAFGDVASLFLVFLYLFMIGLIAGIESNTFAGIARQVFPALDAPALIVGVFVIVVVVNVLGQEFSKNAQLAIVAFMLGGVLLLSLDALVQLPWPLLAMVGAPSEVQLQQLPAAAVTGFFLFVGFEWVTTAQSGSRSAAAQLPAVLLTAVAVLGGFYLLFTAAAVAHLSPAELGATSTPQMLLAQRLWGAPGTWALLLVSCCAVLMAFNAGVLGASRLLYALAREGCLPSPLGFVALRTGAPVAAILATALLGLCCAGVVYRSHNAYLLGNVAAVIICLCYAGLVAASLRLGRAKGPSHVPPLSRSERALHAAGLLAMAGLLGAVLLQDASLHLAGIVGAALGVALLFALITHWQASPARTRWTALARIDPRTDRAAN